MPSKKRKSTAQKTHWNEAFFDDSFSLFILPFPAGFSSIFFEESAAALIYFGSVLCNAGRRGRRDSQRSKLGRLQHDQGVGDEFAS